MVTRAPYDRGVTSVRIRPRALGRVRPGLLAPVAIAIVLGILGMHGVDAHAVHLHGDMAPAQAAAPSPAAIPARTVMSPSRHTSDAMGDAGGVGDTGAMSGMVVLCVAMLAGTAAVLLTLLVRRGRPPRVWAVLQLARRAWCPAPHTLRVGTGPPHAWRFSVIRC